MNDGFQSADPHGVATISGASRSGSARPIGVISPEAEAGGVSSVPESPRGSGDSRVPGRLFAADPPLPRWRDARAELPALRAQLVRAEAERDVERERLIAAALARALIKRRA